MGSIAWAADSKTLFYTTEDEVTKRHDHLFRHRLGEPAAQDVVVYEEKDERFNLGVGKTRDGKYLLMEAGSHTTSECRFLSAETPEGEFRMIAPRVDEQEYSVDHRDGLFYIRTNDVGKNFRVVTAPVDEPGREFWTELIPLDSDAPLEDFELFASFCVSSQAEGWDCRPLTVSRFGAEAGLGESREIAFPEPVYSARSHANPEFETEKFRYSYQSLVSPASVYEYDVQDGESTLLKQQEVPGGFDSIALCFGAGVGGGSRWSEGSGLGGLPQAISSSATRRIHSISMAMGRMDIRCRSGSARRDCRCWTAAW